MNFGHLVELFALHSVQRAESLHDAARRVERVRVGLHVATDDLENVNAARKRIRDRAEAISRKRFAVAVLASDAVGVRTRIDLFAPFLFVVRRVRSEIDEAIKQRAESNLSDARNSKHRTEFALRDRVV